MACGSRHDGLTSRTNPTRILPALALLAACGSSVRSGPAAGGNAGAGESSTSGASGGLESGTGGDGTSGSGAGVSGSSGKRGSSDGGSGGSAPGGGGGSSGTTSEGGAAEGGGNRGGAAPSDGGSAGVPCGGVGSGGKASGDDAPPPAGTNTVLRWYENEQFLGEQSGNALLIFQTDFGANMGKSMAELPVNNVYHQPMRLSFDQAATLTPGLYSCEDGIDAEGTSATAAPVSLYVLDGTYASVTPDSWSSTSFLPFYWSLLGAHRACGTDSEGFSSTAWVRVDTAGEAVSAEFDLAIASNRDELACATLRVHGVLKDVPVEQCALSQECIALLGHDLGIRAEP
jgi:hypothetical protein